uniref:Uncharacterized protein n=1 Tax=Daphnia galeata TaxID=27404 RepID=A0A8J2W6A4_9CRUS|nr:unnamed protein product [Daphnia galeata]
MVVMGKGLIFELESLAVRLTNDSLEGPDLAAQAMAESYLATVNSIPVTRKDFSSGVATENVVKCNVDESSSNSQERDTFLECNPIGIEQLYHCIERKNGNIKIEEGA